MSYKDELIKLVNLYPDLPIIPATFFEVCAEDWGYWAGKIESVKLDYYYLDDNGWYAGEGYIKEELFEKFEEQYTNMTDNEYNLFIDSEFAKLVNEGKVIKAIIIFIGL